LADFCKHLGGDRVAVQVLIPPGASPHVFEPPPSVIANASRARVFVYIGAGLEPWAQRLLAAGDSRDRVVVQAAQGLPLIADVPDEEPGHEAAHHEEDHHHEGGNPHVWLDPVLAQEICLRISAAFIQADPGHRPEYEARLKDYLQKLGELDREIKKQVADFRLREFISFHPAFSYFARRYGLREAGVIELSPGREPSPRHLQRLIAAIRRYGIRVIFAEPQLSPRVAEVIAQEAGVKVLLLDPMGGRPPYGSDYLQLMRHNLAVLAQAMK
jgi:zinc transport system substrate-binding protein